MILTVGSLSRRRCPQCGGRKDYYAEMCRTCRKAAGLYGTPLKGRKGSDHPAWKGGQLVDRDGYIRTYAPDHPWPRRGGYVLEHVRVMELHLGRRLSPTETVHHKDHDRQNNELSNLEVIERGAHSRHHRRLDISRRKRDQRGRFAKGGGA